MDSTSRQENTEDNIENQEMYIAETVQQEYYEYFGDRDWDLYEKDEEIILKRNVGFSLFGPPDNLPTESNETGYTNDQNEQINKIYTLLLNNNNAEDKTKLYIRFIYICWNFTHEDKPVVGRTPIFVLRKCLEYTKCEEYSSKINCKIFIDVYGRVYDNWECFLKNNKLPKCTMVCPMDGQYKGITIGDRAQVLLEYHESPALGTKQKVLNATDIAGTTVSVLTTVGGLASLAVAAPALGVATAVGGAVTATYMVGRNIYTLTDRGLHQQSIGLDNSESRWSWFGIATGAVGTAATAATGVVRSMASQGQNISKTTQIGLNILNGVNMVGSTSGIIANAYNLFDKYRNNENITPLEIFQFSASLLFFYRSVVDFQTAENLISNAQEKTLQNYEKSLRSNRHRKVFRKALKETERLNGKLEGRAEVISGINNIADKDMFFASLTRMNKDMNKAGARFEITADGNIRINSAHIVDPNEFASMTRGSRTDVLNNLPPRVITVSQTDFNNSKVLVTNSMDVFKILGASKFVLSCINFEGNGDSFALIMINLVRSTVDKLFSILIKFLDEIQYRVADYVKVFPLAPIAVGALQFIINYLKNLAKQVHMEIDQFILCVFNADGSVNKEFLTNVIRDFNIWLDDRISSFSVNRNRPSTSTQVQRKRKSCTTCNGHYYD